MSGNLGSDDTVVETTPDEPDHDCVEITASKNAKVGNATVRRSLPQRTRRTVGPWCFEDHFGPTFVTETTGLDIGPHPHMGLHTVTWLVAGEVVHRDSLGTEQLIKPGQLNLMTAGEGVSHAEERTGSYRGEMHGVQLWVAQPEATRNGAAAFEHHAELPQVEVDRSVVTVLAGTFGDTTSTARQDHPMIGVDGQVRAGETVWPLNPAFEHGLIVLSGEVSIRGQHVTPGNFAYLGLDREQLELAATDDARVLLIGGEPFPEPIVMWWNYVGRSIEELGEANDQWLAGNGRFGDVASQLKPIPPPEFIWRR